MKTKYRTRIKINGVGIEVSMDLKNNEIKFKDRGSSYHFTVEEQVEIQKKIRRILQKAAEEKFKR